MVLGQGSDGAHPGVVGAFLGGPQLRHDLVDPGDAGSDSFVAAVVLAHEAGGGGEEGVDGVGGVHWAALR
jgi:hypothetical protein